MLLNDWHVESIKRMLPKVQEKSQNLQFNMAYVTLNRCREIGIDDTFQELSKVLDDFQKVIEAFERFLGASSFAQIKRVLDTYPLLLTPLVDPILNRFVKSHLEKEEEEEFLSERMRFLKACREVGVQQAIDRETNKRFGKAVRAIGDLLQATSWREVERILVQHSVLLTDAALGMLSELAENTPTRVDRYFVEANINLLRECRTKGVSGVLHERLSYESEVPFEESLVQGHAATERFEELETLEAADNALEAWERILERREAWTTRANLRAALLGEMVTILKARFDICGDLADVDRAIQIANEALLLQDNDSIEGGEYQGVLGNLLMARYTATEHYEDLNAAIDAYQKAISLLESSEDLIAESMAAAYRLMLSGVLRLQSEAGGAIDEGGRP